MLEDNELQRSGQADTSVMYEVRIRLSPTIVIVKLTAHNESRPRDCFQKTQISDCVR